MATRALAQPPLHDRSTTSTFTNIDHETGRLPTSKFTNNRRQNSRPKPSAVTGAALIDETATPTSQGYQLTRIYRTKTHHTIRVDVLRDSYIRQSYARAQVLNSGLTWTTLLEEPPLAWYEDTQPYCTPGVSQSAAVRKLLGGIAARLITRAAAVMS